MFRTPLCDKLASSGAVIGTYAGAETALTFGDPRREFGALRSSCGVYDLGWRAKLVVTGSDRNRWLNGMVTNNVRDLALNRGNYNFILSPQGRILGDCYIYNRGEHYIVDTEVSQVETIKSLFDRYIIMDDVEVTDLTDKLTSIAVHGPRAADVLKKAGFEGLDADPMELCDVTWRGIGLSVTRMASEEFLTYELWSSPQNTAAIWDAVVEAGAMPAGMEALELFRVAAGVPRYGRDIRERDLPQETEQTYALHFSKGCYVGQEIVERIRSRGQVHRTFTGFQIEGPPPAPGTKIQIAGNDVGEITSAASVPSSDAERTLALGYIRREHSQPGTKVEVSGVRATVAAIPFAEAKALSGVEQ